MFKVLQLATRHQKEILSSARLATNSQIQTTPIAQGLSLCGRYLVRHSSSDTKMASALVIIADGTEEMEAVITADVLRRGKVATTIAGLKSDKPVKCSCGVKLCPDMPLDEAIMREYDAVILPGGLEGAKAFCASSMLGELLKKQEAAGKICAAICAAPTAFKEHGIGLGKSLTSYPSVAIEFKYKYKYIESKSVVVDGNLVTSRGPGTAFDFALKLVEILVNKKTSDEIKAGMLLE